jgi:hypothetical protein
VSAWACFESKNQFNPASPPSNFFRFVGASDVGANEAERGRDCDFDSNAHIVSFPLNTIQKALTLKTLSTTDLVLSLPVPAITKQPPILEHGLSPTTPAQLPQRLP